MKETMIQFLMATWAWAGIDGLADDIEVAIYWFAADYHEGQTSELYSILSTSPYTPGRMTNSHEDEGETVTMLYDSLVEKFGK